MLCRDNNVLIVWLGLGTKTTWLGLRRRSCFGWPGSVATSRDKISSLVATNKAGGRPDGSLNISDGFMLTKCWAVVSGLADFSPSYHTTAIPSTSYMTCTVEIIIWYVCHIISRKVKCWLGCCSTATVLHYWLFRSTIWSLAQRHFNSFQYIQSTGRHFSQTDGTHMYLKSYFVHLWQRSGVRWQPCVAQIVMMWWMMWVILINWEMAH